MSKVKNVRRRQARRWMMREWAREVAARTPVYPNPCWFRFPPALVPRVMDPPTSGRRWKKLTESYRLTRKAVDAEIDALITRCEESPDHEHSPY